MKTILYGVLAAGLITILGVWALRSGHKTEEVQAPAAPVVAAAVPTEVPVTVVPTVPVVSEAPAPKKIVKKHHQHHKKIAHHRVKKETVVAEAQPAPVEAPKMETKMDVEKNQAGKSETAFGQEKQPAANKPGQTLVMNNRLGTNAFRSKFHLTLDGLLTQSVARKRSTDMLNGYGGNLRLEWEFLPFMSLGVGTNLALYSGSNPSFVASSFDILGSLIPINEPGFQGYLIGGLGRNLGSPAKAWVGHNRGFAGIGTRLGLFSTWSLDMGLIYDMFSPDAGPLQALDGRIGLSYAISL